MKKRIKILYFLSTAEYGGTETKVLALVTHLPSDQFDRHVCFLGNQEGPISKQLQRNNIPVTFLNFRVSQAYQRIKTIYSFFKEHAFDIIHVYGLRANLITRIIGKIARMPIILGGLESIHSSDHRDDSDSPLPLFLDRITMPLIKAYVSNSQAAVDFFISKGFPPEQFHVIYNGIQVALYQNASKIQNQFNKMPVIVNVANLRHVKHHDLLINACAKLKRNGTPFHLNLVGKGPLKDSILQQINALGLTNEVSLLGERSDIPYILSTSDIFVLSSYFEGMPVSIMEAMASGLPIISTDVGGVSELVDNGNTGILVPSNHVDLLSRAIELLLLNPSLRQKMGAAGRNKVQTEFSFQTMINHYISYYSQLYYKKN